jgi:hypothetical protein
MAATTSLHAGHAAAEGARVTHAALEAGYSTPSAFISMFRKTLGSTPTSYFKFIEKHFDPGQVHQFSQSAPQTRPTSRDLLLLVRNGQIVEVHVVGILLVIAVHLKIDG